MLSGRFRRLALVGATLILLAAMFLGHPLVAA
jgi:hypothetical protein